MYVTESWEAHVFLSARALFYYLLFILKNEVVSSQQLPAENLSAIYFY